MIKSSNYRDLIVWQKALDLSVYIYQLVYLLPSEEKFVLSDQMRRCAVSVPSNIAEGVGRGTEKETIRFLYISKGSLCELDTQLEICKRLNFISEEHFNNLQSDILEIKKMLESLISYRSNY